MDERDLFNADAARVWAYGGRMSGWRMMMKSYCIPGYGQMALAICG